jgi:uncharacterized membrane protein YdcZ (DUF606 family)
MPAAPATTPLVSGVPNRPSTVIGFLSDVTSNPKQAATFVFVVGAIIFIASVCFMGACLAVAVASKGIKGPQLRYMWPFGVGGASMVTLVTTLVVRWILRKLWKAAKGDAGDGSQNDGSQ